MQQLITKLTIKRENSTAWLGSLRGKSAFSTLLVRGGGRQPSSRRSKRTHLPRHAGGWCALMGSARGRGRGPRTETMSRQVCPVCAAPHPLFRAEGLGVTLELSFVLSFTSTHPMTFIEHLLSAQCHVLRRSFE